MGNAIKTSQKECEILDEMYDQYNRIRSKMFVLKNLLYTTQFNMQTPEMKMIIHNVRYLTKHMCSAKTEKDCKKLKKTGNKIIKNIDVMILKVQEESEKQQPDWIIETLRRHKRN